MIIINRTSNCIFYIYLLILSSVTVPYFLVISEVQDNIIPLTFNRNDYVGQSEGGSCVCQFCAGKLKDHRSVNMKQLTYTSQSWLQKLSSSLFLLLTFLFTPHSVYFQLAFMCDTIPSLPAIGIGGPSLVLTFSAVFMSSPEDIQQRTHHASSTQDSISPLESTDIARTTRRTDPTETTSEKTPIG